eukprot:5238910-Amphidinium_carterae.1
MDQVTPCDALLPLKPRAVKCNSAPQMFALGHLDEHCTRFSRSSTTPELSFQSLISLKLPQNSFPKPKAL